MGRLKKNLSKNPVLSSLRRQGSSLFQLFWIPAFAGMTNWHTQKRTFCFALAIALFFLASACGVKQRPPSALTSRPPESTANLSKKDHYQAKQWLDLAQKLEMTSDYVTSLEYCEKILSRYPDTLYADEATLIVEMIKDPSKNRRRDLYRNNPALFMGY